VKYKNRDAENMEWSLVSGASLALSSMEVERELSCGSSLWF